MTLALRNEFAICNRNNKNDHSLICHISLHNKLIFFENLKIAIIWRRMEPGNQKDYKNSIALRQQQQQHDDLLVETWTPKDINLLINCSVQCWPLSNRAVITVSSLVIFVAWNQNLVVMLELFNKLDLSWDCRLLSSYFCEYMTWSSEKEKHIWLCILVNMKRTQQTGQTNRWRF